MVFTGLVLGSVVGFAVPSGESRAGGDASQSAAPFACAQWEVMSGSDGAASLTNELPQYGKGHVTKAPAGWEPFASSVNGILLFRRCLAPAR
ncbi:MAG: hypothetical protein V2A73_20190 [Pseudomonadota bacterium]